MKRRQFIVALATVLASMPRVACAQPQSSVRRIGLLIGGDESDPIRRRWIAEFRTSLEGLGWIDGRNIRTDLRWASADPNRAIALAVGLVKQTPDVLFADNTFVVQALQTATKTVPVVFARISDPIAYGFVKSLASPAGNMTGFSNSEPSTLAKFVEFLKEVAPRVRRIAIVVSANQWQSPTGKKSLDTVASAALSDHLESTLIEADSAVNFERAITEFGRLSDGAIVVPGDPGTTAQRKLILRLAERYTMPVMGNAQFLAEGGLLSYAAAPDEQYSGAAGYVDRILRGAKIAELPVQQPTKYELRINLKAAKTLGLEVPPNLLAVADEIVE